MAIIRYPKWLDFPGTFHEMGRLRGDMDRLYNELMGKSPFVSRSGVFPPMNLSEDSEAIYVQAEVPGINPDSIEISVLGNTLSLQGERRFEDVGNVSYHRRERSAGRFHKAITLPSDVNAEAVKAECVNGVLKIVLPKAEQVKPKKITVKVD